MNQYPLSGCCSFSWGVWGSVETPGYQQMKSELNLPTGQPRLISCPSSLQTGSSILCQRQFKHFGALMNPKYIVNTLTVLSHQHYVFIRKSFLSQKCDALTVHHLINFSFFKVKHAGYVLSCFPLRINSACCLKKKKEKENGIRC